MVRVNSRVHFRFIVAKVVYVIYLCVLFVLTCTVCRVCALSVLVIVRRTAVARRRWAWRFVPICADYTSALC